MRPRFFTTSIIPLFALTAANLCLAQQIVVMPDKTNGVYQVGETVHWNVEWKADTNGLTMRYWRNIETEAFSGFADQRTPRHLRWLL